MFFHKSPTLAGLFVECFFVVVEPRRVVFELHGALVDTCASVMTYRRVQCDPSRADFLVAFLREIYVGCHRRDIRLLNTQLSFCPMSTRKHKSRD